MTDPDPTVQVQVIYLGIICLQVTILSTFCIPRKAAKRHARTSAGDRGSPNLLSRAHLRKPSKDEHSDGHEGVNGCSVNVRHELLIPTKRLLYDRGYGKLWCIKFSSVFLSFLARKNRSNEVFDCFLTKNLEHELWNGKYILGYRQLSIQKILWRSRVWSIGTLNKFSCLGTINCKTTTVRLAKNASGRKQQDSGEYWGE